VQDPLFWLQCFSFVLWHGPSLEALLGLLGFADKQFPHLLTNSFLDSLVTFLTFFALATTWD
jgi:hypothetical protein